MPFLVLLLTLLAIPLSLPACQCAGPPGTACSDLAEASASFLGRVTRDSGRGFGRGRARMVIEEVFRGVPTEMREVEVETGALTSCYMRLRKGERYVIFGYLDRRNPNLVHNPGCTNSFNVHGNEVLLDALREANKLGPSRLVGRVYKKTNRYGLGDRAGPGIRVIAEQDGERLVSTTMDFGQFSFQSIAPGPWQLRVDQPGLVTQSIFPEEPLTIPVNGCEVRYLSVTADGRIGGTVRGANGHPIAGVSVQAFEIKENGDPETSSYREAMTDAAGAYVIDSLPAQEYVIGVNGHKYKDRLAYAPSFYSQVENRDKAARVRLEEQERKDGIDLLLREPRAPAMLVVEVTYEDGTPALGAGAKVLDLRGIQRAFAKEGSGKGGVLQVPFWQGESCRVEAWLYDSKTIRRRGSREQYRTFEWRGSAEPVSLSAPETSIKVVLRLVPRK